MRDKDVVFAANADAVDVSKFLAFLNNINATANGGLATATNANVLRIDSHIH
jgi:hypothetical protein